MCSSHPPTPGLLRGALSHAFDAVCKSPYSFGALPAHALSLSTQACESFSRQSSKASSGCLLSLHEQQQLQQQQHMAALGGGGSVRSSCGSDSAEDDFAFCLDDLLPLDAVEAQVRPCNRCCGDVAGVAGLLLVSQGCC